MEMASVLSGERWSDHPRCTHPVLAELSRLVNDHTTDRHRSELAGWIPLVVGLNARGEDLRWTVGLTAAIASHAVTRVPADSQRPLVVGLHTVQRVMAARRLAAVPGTENIHAALDSVPEAVRCAPELGKGPLVGPRLLRVLVAPAVARTAVKGLATSRPDDPDGALRELLVSVIAVAQRLRDDDARASQPGRQGSATPRPVHPGR